MTESASNDDGNAPGVHPDDVPAKRVAGRYRLLGPLGQGGMGTVWRARDEVLGREVAVKEVRAPGGMDPSEVDRMYRRLEREAWAAARVSHRGVVTVYDVATDDGRPWIVMEIVRGLSLAEVLEGDGPLSPQRTAHIGEQVLSALRAAHEAGVLHRDVKPGNVLIADDGRVVLGDFGIASLEGSTAITMAGEVVGSPEFLSPERALGNDPSPATDLWALGVMLYTAVEGASPFRRNTPVATLRAVVDDDFPPPLRAGALAPVLEGLLAKDPERRLPAAEAARLLRIVGAGGTVRAFGGTASGPTMALPAGAASGQEVGPDTPASTARRSRGRHAPPGATPAPAPLAAVGGPRRPGRAGAVLSGGIVLLAVVVALLGWLLWKDLRITGGFGGAGPTPSAAPSPSAAAPTSPSPSPSPSESPAESPAASPSAVPAAQFTLSAVQAVRDGYRGTCPAPAADAPAFTATVAVDRTPAVLEYRWATRSGETSGPGWQTVTYPSGGPGSMRLDHTELTSYPDATFEDAVRLEIRTPEEAASAWLEYSVTCAEETPTSGAPSPAASGPSGSPSPEPGATVSP
ncbi:serine/threonine-protein kinase [Streptomyces sp. NPDC006544]|uniref:serine/threonine-protein kinase n=1 Tax=Streptomyces sp. NPDC006544 TaxID=3154583 RepID=UPI00339F6BAA